MIRHGNVYMTITDTTEKLPFYLTCVGKWRSQYPIEREEGWPDYQWIQCTGGQGIVEVGGVERTAQANQGFLLFPDERHSYYPTVEPWEVHWMSFNGSKVSEMLGDLDFTGSQVLSLTHPDPILAKLSGLLAVAKTGNPMSYLECSSIVYDIILDLHRYGSMTNIRSKQQYFTQLTPAIQYIENNYHQQMTLDDLANILFLSKQHTCLLFKQTLGVRPFEFITSVRLRKAKELLMQEPELSIAELGRMVGYEQPSYFIKIFKRYEGITPKKFRSIQ